MKMFLCADVCEKKCMEKRTHSCNSSVEKRFEQHVDEKRTFLITI